MWSRYLRTREKDGIVAIFHELHPDPVYCSKERWSDLYDNGIANGAEMLINGLKKCKLIINSADDDLREFKMVEANLERKLNQPIILYLMVAQGCNFGCGYCPVPETVNKHGASLLSVEDALAGIELWQKHLKDVYDPTLQYFVIFYGGEPLLNKETIKASLAYLEMKKNVRDLPPNISYMIATNGVLIDEETIAMCKKYKVMMTVGLDGPKEINDVLRVDSDGNGTFDRAVSSIRLLVANKIRTFISASITPFNLDHISECSSFFRDLGVEKFGFNFLKGHMLTKLIGQEGVEDYYRRASRGIIDNARRQGNSGFEYQMEKKQLAFDSGDFYPVDCTCYGNQLVIQPDGQVSNCPFYKSWLGHIKSVSDDFRIWNQPIVREWRKKLPLFHPGEAKAVNGGGCAWSSVDLKGDPAAVDDSSQIFPEEVLNDLIWFRYDRLCAREA